MTEAYCPDCEAELTATEYTITDGCGHCGRQDVWLSQDAFTKAMDKVGTKPSALNR